MNLFIHDSGHRGWGQALLTAARSRGHYAQLIDHLHQIDRSGYGFIRLSAHFRELVRGQNLYINMAEYLTMIQDTAQIMSYDNKRHQYKVWGDLMPDTWVFNDEQEALEFLHTNAQFPIISKSDVGASSRNVRYIPDLEEAIGHVQQIFGPGIRVDHCSIPRAYSLQTDYVYFQKFIPHNTTYRVNIVGRQRCIFLRYNYPHRPLAQTGNVEPIKSLDLYDSLLQYADFVFDRIKTKWCALDILQDGDEWKLLETSHGWPWPSPGDCNNGVFFPSGKKWIDMFDVLIDEIEAGTWH